MIVDSTAHIDQNMLDPTNLLRWKDSLYATDLLVAAIGWLDLFNWLADNASASMQQIMQTFQIHERPTDVMLTLLVAMEILEYHEKVYSLTPIAKHFLLRSSPLDLSPYFSSQKEREACRALYEVLRTGKPAGWAAQKQEEEWAKHMMREDFAQLFTSAMDGRGAYFGPKIAAAIDFKPYKRLLDIGGSSGIYATSIVADHTHINATILDRLPVTNFARQAIKNRGLDHRLDVVEGDMMTSIPQGFDIHLFSNVLHDWDELTVRKLLKRSFDALEPEGLIIIHGSHLNSNKDGPLPVAQFSVLLMLVTQGRCYSVNEMETYLQEANFQNIKYISMPADRSLIIAHKS